MQNQQIADVLALTAKLLELYSENPFRIKSYQTAAYEIENFPKEISVFIAESKDYELPFHKSILEKIKEIVQTGTLKILEELLSKTPSGVIEMFNIKGLGPKKIQIIWFQLGIDNLGDLLHACYENRLKEVKGFGIKTQESIKKSIEFYFLSKGKLHIHKAFEYLKIIQEKISFPLFPTGKLLTWDNVFDYLEFVTTHDLIEVKVQFSQLDFLITNENNHYFVAKNSDNITIKVYFSSPENLEKSIFEHTLEESNPNVSFPSLILPQHRYHPKASDFYKKNSVYIDDKDIKGLVHCHSTYSDGKNTLKELSNACIKLGYQYMVITDHSQSAFYANGLSPSRLEVQWNEIDELNQKFKNFQIFKGIESDILSDGSLDYPEEILKRFDCVIASIHSNFKMDMHHATQRLIKAIENPYTRILGHLTGRLLLIREGYPIDHQKIIDACVQNQVAIEINSNPFRLDIDWSWLRRAVDLGVQIFINPDAHSVEGIQDTHWGVMLANKAFLESVHVVNTLNLSDFEQWIKRKK